jgi:hypothetical protein
MYSNAICLYSWLFTILRKNLNLPVVTKGFSWNDPPSWKQEILRHVYNNTQKWLKFLPCKHILVKFYKNWSVHEAKKKSDLYVSNWTLSYDVMLFMCESRQQYFIESRFYSHKYQFNASLGKLNLRP